MMSERDDKKKVLRQMEVQVEKSKLSVEVAKKLIQNLRKNKVNDDDFLKIVLVDDDILLRFIACEYLESRGVKKNKIANCLSVVCSKTMHLNLNSPKCLEVMQEYLVDFHYCRYINGGLETSAMNKMEDDKRLVIIKNCVDKILESCKPGDYYQCDEKFLYLLRFLSMQLVLLGPEEKAKLKSVDCIEYCVNILYLIHRSRYDVVRLFLNKLSVLKILEGFKDILKNDTIPNNSFFEDLERQTFIIKNLVALTKSNIFSCAVRKLDIDIQTIPQFDYTEKLLSGRDSEIETETEPKIAFHTEVGTVSDIETESLAICRSLHVFGELSKNTKWTKSISPKMRSNLKSLNDCMYKDNTNKIRDMLSHNYSIYRLRYFDDLKPSYYKKLQGEIRNLEFVFQSMQRMHFDYSMEQFLDTVDNCENEEQVMSLLKYIEPLDRVHFDEFKHSKAITNILINLKENIIPELREIEHNDIIFSKLVQTLETIMSSFFREDFNDKYTISFTDLKHVMKYYSPNCIKQYTKYFRCTLNVYQWKGLFAIRMIFGTMKNLMNLLCDFPGLESLHKTITDMTVDIANNFEYFFQISELNERLNYDAGNPLWQLRNRQYYENIYRDMGRLTENELKKHPNYETEFKKMMTALNKHSSVNVLHKKFLALEKYFDALGKTNPTALSKIRAKEEAEVQKIFNEKISLLGRLPSSNDASYDMASAHLALEILEILNGKILEDNLFQLEEITPILCGRNLRNFLAHVSISHEVVAFDFKSLVRIVKLNVSTISKKFVQCKLYEKRESEKGVATIKSNFDDELHMIELQGQLYDSIKQLDLKGFELAIEKGAIVQGRNSQDQNVLELCINSNFEVFEQYGEGKIESTSNNYKFIDKFLDIIPQDLFLRVEFTRAEVPIDILLEAHEAISNEQRDKIETDFLSKACASGSLETVTLIINGGNNYNLNCGLLTACQYGFIDIVEFLITKIDPIVLSEDLCFYLGLFNDIRLFKLIIPKCGGINQIFGPKRHTLLSCSVIYNNDIAIIEYLIEKGASFNQKDSNGYSIVNLAVLHNRMDLYSLFYEHSLFENEIERNTLYMACLHGQTEWVKTLLESKIEFSNLEDCFATATLNQLMQIVELLMKHHGERFKKFDREVLISLFSIADCYRSPQLFELFCRNTSWTEPEFKQLLVMGIHSNDYDIFNLVVIYGEQFSEKVKNYDDLLLSAVQFENLDIVKKLVELGCDYTPTNRQEGTGCTCLQLAVTSDAANYKILEYLLQLEGCGLEDTDNEGRTALFWAMDAERVAEASILLAKGADLKKPNRQGVKPIEAAVYTFNSELINLAGRYYNCE